jgi:hypothetical protein
MSIEALLLSALSAVTGALVFVVKLLWARSEQCEKDRVELREEIEHLKETKGMAEGTLKAFGMCPAAACPFKARNEA